MPEGPEIRLAADRLHAAMAGRVAVEVQFTLDHLQSYAPALSGETITAVKARSKAMLVNFANGLTIYSHNQLYGRWYVRPARDYPDTNRQLRIAIHNQQKSALLYSATDIAVLAEAELADHPYLRKLGPELLEPETTVAEVAARFRDRRFRRRRLDTLLLDQGFLAGMGNYLRSETLFVARVKPTARPAECDDDQVRQLADAALSLTRRSYRTKGITNDPALADYLRQAGYPRRDQRFWVFGRDGAPCHICSTAILKTRLSGRRLYYCPRCQPAPQ
ncbi:MAG: endonuclease VIII [Candidatus Promineifilaceae bacterium]|nr:endonuclease VIII [Candidatus Promineifilaceae bacterium]